MPRSRPTLTPDEARTLHHEALVIDSQQPPATTGFLFTDRMRATVAELRARKMGRDEAHPLLVDLAQQELLTSSAAREQYLEFWHASGVTVACGTYSGAHRMSDSYEMANRRLAQAHAVVEALGGELVLCRTAADIERAHATRKHGLVLDRKSVV